MMRFVLSLIVSSFFLIAPFQGDAGVVSGKPLTANIENGPPGNKLIDYPIIDNPAIAITHSGQHNTPANQYRFYSFSNPINTIAYKNGATFLYDTEHLVQPYLYCKRIGLTLLFPEHYFW